MAQRLCIRTQGKVSTVRVLAGVLELPGCLRIPGAYIQIVTPGPYPRDPDPGDPEAVCSGHCVGLVLQRATCPSAPLTDEEKESCSKRLRPRAVEPFPAVPPGAWWGQQPRLGALRPSRVKRGS